MNPERTQRPSSHQRKKNQLKKPLHLCKVLGYSINEEPGAVTESVDLVALAFYISNDAMVRPYSTKYRQLNPK
jgi:hypothetical protein